MGFNPEEKTRRCHLCRDIKLPQAFVGSREACRSCWLSVPESDKSKYILNAKAILLSRIRAKDDRKGSRKKKPTSSPSV